MCGLGRIFKGLLLVGYRAQAWRGPLRSETSALPFQATGYERASWLIVTGKAASSCSETLDLNKKSFPLSPTLHRGTFHLVHGAKGFSTINLKGAMATKQGLQDTSPARDNCIFLFAGAENPTTVCVMGWRQAARVARGYFQQKSIVRGACSMQENKSLDT